MDILSSIIKILANGAVFFFFIGLLIMLIAKSLKKPSGKNAKIFSYSKQKNNLVSKISNISSRKVKIKKAAKKNAILFVIDFVSDVNASNVDILEKQIDAILSLSKKGDEVMVKVFTPGGAVYAYGLAYSQLNRIKEKGLKLYVAVDKVAASGGYLMACVADEIMAAPFAILGSIGVVAQIPNFRRWLNDNKIDIEEHTAGKYKRTITPLGEITEEGRRKFKESLSDIHNRFKEVVQTNRPNLDIEKVAQGEHWLGLDAHKLGLVDTIKTSATFLDHKSETFEVLIIDNKPYKSFSEKLMTKAFGILNMNPKNLFT